MLTKRGIAKNLEESPYFYEYNDMIFYFSSQLHLNNFMKLIASEIDRFNVKTNNIYKDKFNLEMQNLALIRLYAIIEKRGFFIKIKGESVASLENVEFQMIPIVKPG